MPTRKSYAGAAVPTTISSGAFAIGATSFSMTVATGWPTTAGGPFVAVVDRGLATEEHVLVAARSGTSCTSVTRGYDSTSEVTHASNATLEHRWDAVSADEANRIGSLLTTKGDLVAHDGTQPQRLAVGATAGMAPLVTTAASTGIAWGQPLANLVTTKGDLLAATGSGVIARLAAGSNQQYLAADSAQTAGVGYTWKGLPVFTSTALRDAAITAPTAGMACYIDSNDVSEGLYIYTHAASWRKGPGWNAPWGIIALGVDTTPRNSSINSGTGLVVFPTLSFAPLTGRYYKMTWHAAWVDTGSTSANGTLSTLLADQAGVTIQNLTVTRFGGDATGGSDDAVIYWTPTTGSLTGVQVRAVSTLATASVYQNSSYGSYLCIEDVGSSGAPT